MGRVGSAGGVGVVQTDDVDGDSEPGGGVDRGERARRAPHVRSHPVHLRRRLDRDAPAEPAAQDVSAQDVSARDVGMGCQHRMSAQDVGT